MLRWPGIASNNLHRPSLNQATGRSTGALPRKAVSGRPEPGHARCGHWKARSPWVANGACPSRSVARPGSTICTWTSLVCPGDAGGRGVRDGLGRAGRLSCDRLTEAVDSVIQAVSIQGAVEVAPDRLATMSRHCARGHPAKRETAWYGLPEPARPGSRSPVGPVPKTRGTWHAPSDRAQSGVWPKWREVRVRTVQQLHRRRCQRSAWTY